MRTLKEEPLWLCQWPSPLELERALAAWRVVQHALLAFAVGLSDTLSG